MFWGEDMSRHIMHKNSIINSDKCQEKKQAGDNTQIGSSDQKNSYRNHQEH